MPRDHVCVLACEHAHDPQTTTWPALARNAVQSALLRHQSKDVSVLLIVQYVLYSSTSPSALRHLVPLVCVRQARAQPSACPISG